MELEITGKGADLQNVFVLIFFKSPRNNAGPLSQEGVKSSANQKLIYRKESGATPFRKINRRISRKGVKLSRSIQV